ncbi:MAG: P1 family peptidase [Gemmatimonadota bacterium]|nr:P1 family peptidase [Gemmatimonadota bacterium]
MPAALTLAAGLVGAIPQSSAAQGPPEGAHRPRAADLGVRIGRLPAGPHGAITDVAGVRVGHATVWEGDSIRTGVTAILPHPGDLFAAPVRAGIVVGNGFGKLVGLSQVQELGEIETPILLTGTLSVFRAADALLDTLLATPGYETVRSLNPVVGETNDGWLSDIRARPIRPEHVRAALRDARSGPVAEGTVGAGTGTRALGWKGGIGTASRMAPPPGGREGPDWRVGVLVQSNFGGSLVVDGVPAGRLLADAEGRPGGPPADARGGGSVMIVVATDAPLDARGLERLAARAFGGLARTGAALSHGSGDYAIAFTTDRGPPARLDGAVLTVLFRAVQEATEEAILNSLLRATDVTGFAGRSVRAVPVDRLRDLLSSPEGSPGPPR